MIVVMPIISALIGGRLAMSQICVCGHRHGAHLDGGECLQNVYRSDYGSEAVDLVQCECPKFTPPNVRATPMSATWNKPWPFDPTDDLPPEGAAVTVPEIKATFTFDASSGYWTDGHLIAYPFGNTGIRLARLWAKELS